MNTEKRTNRILVKLTPTEKARIEKYAAQYGGTVSEFIRNCILDVNPLPNGVQIQNIVAHLCKIDGLINQIENPALRERIVNEEVSIWQLIK